MKNTLKVPASGSFRALSALTRVSAVGLFALAVVSACNGGRGLTNKPDARAAEASPATAGQNEQAKAVIKEMVAAYRRLKSYSDRMELRAAGAKLSEVTTAEVAFAAPAKLAVSFREDGQDSTRVTDGGTYYASSSDHKGQYLRQPMPPRSYGSRALLQYMPAGEAFTPLLSGLDPFQAPWGRAPLSLTLARPTVIDQVPVDIVVARFEDETGGITRETLIAYEVGQKDRLIRRIVTTTRNRDAGGRLSNASTTVETHSDLRINPKLEEQTFRFTPLPGARAVDRFGPATWDDHLQVGATPVPLAGTDTQGKPVSLSQFKGHPVLVTFWATWCPYCRREQPYVVEANRKYAASGLRVLGVSLDTDVGDADKYAAGHGMNWPQLCDGQKWKSQYAKLYGVRSLPFSLLLGSDGKVAAVNPSRLLLGEAVQAALKGRAPAKHASGGGDCAECGVD